MRVLVTGGAGFIGSHVLRLLQGKAQVTVLDNLTSGSRSHIPSGMEFVEGDVRDAAVVEKLFAHRHFDAVIHLAAQTMVPDSIANPILDCQINLKGLLQILENCRNYQVPHVLFSSSAAVYGDNPNVPLLETETLQPLSPYGITKMTAEHYLRVYHELYGINATVFRFANVYGERQGEKGEGGVISIFCRLLSGNQGVTIYGDGSQTRDFVYAGDIAQAMVAALPLTGFHFMNVSTGKETSLQDLLESFRKAVGHAFPIHYAPPRTGDILRSVLSNERLKLTLGIEPAMELSRGIARTYAWYKAQYGK